LLLSGSLASREGSRLGTLIGAVLAALAGLAIATTTVVGIVQTVKENPDKPATNTPVVQYGQR
jgi:Protein of unknown function (DUF2613)